MLAWGKDVNSFTVPAIHAHTATSIAACQSWILDNILFA
ncbi:hypothetical protein K239x_47870 [Planctomycetes bacterium K23_9]|uniref:Uncharacterized protein n=1 Tax=Stieleria marina TaxID=1930275 RepID=A0A517P076_9BACT|nr:hypothetical protein K239x_47870 [Planctomycetes bacterium K23_9]